MCARRSEFLPLCRPSIGEDEIAEVADSLRSGWITTGPKVRRFEEAFDDYVGVQGAIAVSSATAGFHLVLKTLGIGPGDEVILSPITFVSMVNMVELLGAKPVFADVDPRTLLLDASLVQEAVTERTKAIVPVHYAGQPVDLEPLEEICRASDIALIEDAAHAIGTEYKGDRIGARNNITIFSFHPIKNITTGEGGIVLSPDASLADQIRVLRFHGISREAWKRYGRHGDFSYELVEPGYKYNMMDIQAAIGIHQLRRVGQFNEARARLAKRYDHAFEGVNGIAPLTPAPWPHKHAWHLYVVQLELAKLSITRDEFAALLKERNIGTGYHFPAAHLFACYRRKYGFAAEDLPNASAASDRILSLPLFPAMTDEDQDDVMDAVTDILSEARR